MATARRLAPPGTAAIQSANLHGVGADMYMEPSAAFIVNSFDTLGMNLRSFADPLRRAVREVAIPDIEENFRTESYFESEASGPHKWQPLSQRRVEARGSSNPILQDKGKLRRAATAQSRWAISGTRAYVTSNWPVPYARVHQQGFMQAGRTFVGTGMIPARPFMNLRGGAADRTQEIFSSWLEERIMRQGYSWRYGAGAAGSRSRAAGFLRGRGAAMPGFLL